MIFKTKRILNSSEKAIKTRRSNIRVKKLKVVLIKIIALVIVSSLAGTVVLALSDNISEIRVNEYKESLLAQKVAHTSIPSESSDTVEELSPKEYVFKEVEKELGFDEAVFAVSMIGGCENKGWRTDIVIIESNGTVSLGLWQINTIHNNPDSTTYISNADKLDLEKSTAWAINKRIVDGDWSAWSCSRY